MILWKNPLGTEEHLIVGFGTVIMAFLPGFLMRYTEKPAAACLGKLLK